MTPSPKLAETFPLNVMICWICGDTGTTGEHLIKRSDMLAVFGKPTQGAPLYIHDGKRINRRIGSLDNKNLKSPSRICANCNNALSQPYDLAWERMSCALRTRNPPLSVGAIVRANRVFKYDTRRHMIDVQLYFVKLFGCHIVTAGIPKDVSGFANAVLHQKHHPFVYLNVGLTRPLPGDRCVAMSDVNIAKTPDGRCVFATWFYEINGVAVNVMFADDGESREGLRGAWHPRFGTNKLTIADFR